MQVESINSDLVMFPINLKVIFINRFIIRLINNMELVNGSAGMIVKYIIVGVCLFSLLLLWNNIYILIVFFSILLVLYHIYVLYWDLMQ